MKQNDVKEAFRNLSLYITEVHQKAKSFFPEDDYSIEVIDQEAFIYTSWGQIDEEGIYYHSRE